MSAGGLPIVSAGGLPIVSAGGLPVVSAVDFQVCPPVDFQVCPPVDIQPTTLDGVSIFNKIAIPNNKFQMASEQESHWLIETPTIFSSICVARPYQIYVDPIFKHIHTTSSNTIIWQFVPFIYHPL